MDVLVSIAAIKNYQRLDVLKPHRFIIVHFWGSEAQNWSHWTEVVMLSGLSSF